MFITYLLKYQMHSSLRIPGRKTRELLKHRESELNITSEWCSSGELRGYLPPPPPPPPGGQSWPPGSVWGLWWSVQDQRWPSVPVWGGPPGVWPGYIQPPLGTPPSSPPHTQSSGWSQTLLSAPLHPRAPRSPRSLRSASSPHPWCLSCHWEADIQRWGWGWGQRGRARWTTTEENELLQIPAVCIGNF